VETSHPPLTVGLRLDAPECGGADGYLVLQGGWSDMDYLLTPQDERGQLYVGAAPRASALKRRPSRSPWVGSIAVVNVPGVHLLRTSMAVV